MESINEMNENYNYLVNKVIKECNKKIENIKSFNNISNKTFWIKQAEHVKERQIERLNRLFKINN